MEIEAGNDPAEVIYHCRKCGGPYEQRLHRQFLFRHVLFFLPLRRYYCFRCKKAGYVWEHQIK